MELNKFCDNLTNRYLTTDFYYSSAPTAASLDARSQVEVTVNLIFLSPKRMAHKTLLDPDVAPRILEEQSMELIQTRKRVRLILRP